MKEQGKNGGFSGVVHKEKMPWVQVLSVKQDDVDQYIMGMQVKEDGIM